MHDLMCMCIKLTKMKGVSSFLFLTTGIKHKHTCWNVATCKKKRYGQYNRMGEKVKYELTAMAKLREAKEVELAILIL